MKNLEVLFTVDEAARYIKFNPETVRRLIREGKLPAIRMSGRWRIKKSELEAWGEKNTPKNLGGRPKNSKNKKRKR